MNTPGERSDNGRRPSTSGGLGLGLHQQQGGGRLSHSIAGTPSRENSNNDSSLRGRATPRHGQQRSSRKSRPRLHIHGDGEDDDTFELPEDPAEVDARTWREETKELLFYTGFLEKQVVKESSLEMVRESTRQGLTLVHVLSST